MYRLMTIQALTNKPGYRFRHFRLSRSNLIFDGCVYRRMCSYCILAQWFGDIFVILLNQKDAVKF